MKENKKKGTSIITTVILIIAVCVFCYSGFQLYKIFSSYKKGNDEYEKIKEIAVTKVEDEEEIQIDFEQLRQINPDVIAWIKFDEPSVIDYPVVHSHDNNEYLTKLFGEGKNTYGTLFVDMNNSGDFSDRNTFIYGHRMKTGSMFGQLEKYADEEFCKQHPYFYIYTPDGEKTKYQVFSAGVVKESSGSYQREFQSDEEFQTYINLIKADSNYMTDAKVTPSSSIVSLSTCTVDSNEDRFLLHGVKVEE